MSAYTFFGNRQCYGLDTQALKDTIEEFINKGVWKFFRQAKRRGLTVINLGKADVAL